MASGLTYDVKEGKMTEFNDFVMLCVRQMSVCFAMRDDPIDKPIPEKFEPDDFYKEKVQRTHKELQRLEALTIEEADAEYDKRYQESKEAHEKRSMDRQRIRENYQAMLDKVMAWEPPTSEHVPLKRLMVDQLKNGLEWDCSPMHDIVPERGNTKEWLRMRIDSARRNHDMASEEWRKSCESAATRTEYMRALRKSLQGPGEA